MVTGHKAIWKQWSPDWDIIGHCSAGCLVCFWCYPCVWHPWRQWHVAAIWRLRFRSAVWWSKRRVSTLWHDHSLVCSPRHGIPVISSSLWFMTGRWPAVNGWWKHLALRACSMRRAEIQKSRNTLLTKRQGANYLVSSIPYYICMFVCPVGTIFLSGIICLLARENRKNVASLHDKCCTYWTYRHRMKRLSKVFRIFVGVINLLQD